MKTNSTYVKLLRFFLIFLILTNAGTVSAQHQDILSSINYERSSSYRPLLCVHRKSVTGYTEKSMFCGNIKISFNTCNNYSQGFEYLTAAIITFKINEKNISPVVQASQR